MSRDNAQQKSVLRIGFCILTVRKFVLLFRPAVFFTEDKMAVVPFPLVLPK